MPGFEYQQVEIQLEPGDVAVVYSDGITDARSPATSSTTASRTPASTADSPTSPAAPRPSAAPSSRRSASSPTGEPQADDMTIICFGRV